MEGRAAVPFPRKHGRRLRGARQEPDARQAGGAPGGAGVAAFVRRRLLGGEPAPPEAAAWVA
ncbi:MAG TPA: hypothetical protein VHI93_05195 [Candidatus Thermoplasmatota archaeon]|nr:hypothetical protein [Candidatus Thermoplasmatota archaeon]